MHLTKVTHALAHALNMLNGVENSNACVEDYRSFAALWNVNHKDYANKIKRNYALNALATNYKTSV
jgi:putative IMPACT (imprinted ancient) family translation regulator